MNLTEFMMFIVFFLYIGIFLVTLYNIFMVGKFYDMKMVWILFVSQLILFLVSFQVMMTQATADIMTSELIPSLFNIQIVLLEVYFVMLIIQLFFAWKAESTQPTQARRSAELRSQKNEGR